ncbi:MAG: hypothetical protein ACLP50_25450 [Solirubrobacteraceae bacterium]
MTRERALLALRPLAGGVFVAFGLGKFVNHPSELASFRAYGLPAPAELIAMVVLLWQGPGRYTLGGRPDRSRPPRGVSATLMSDGS